ncbi:MAG TPA: hypothetical protein VIQ24_19720 [Pyrinomonadaceae bacterium]
MSDPYIKKIALKCFTLLTLILCLFFFSKDSTKSLLAFTQKGREQRSAPSITVSAQADSPLRILSTEVVSANSQNFRIIATVQNQSTKEIRAYAISSEVAGSTIQVGQVQFMNLTQQTEIWQPSQIKTVEVNSSSNEQIVKVNLMVDFVECSDGTTWGPDTHKSSDILAGQRAGARLEKQRLRQLLKEKGQQAVVDDLQKSITTDLKTTPDRERSSVWIEGFRSGASAVRGRLKRALQSGDVKATSELDKRFDTSEESPR